MADRLRLFAETVSVPDPGELLSVLAGAGAPGFYWESPSHELTFAALGSAAEICAHGPERFERASAAALDLLGAVEVRAGSRPLMVGGFAFADHGSEDRRWREFPALRLFLPQLLWIRDRGGSRLTRTWRAGEPPPGDPLVGCPSRPPPAPGTGAAVVAGSAWDDPRELLRWRQRVESARRAVAGGVFSKVVLARKLEVEPEAYADPAVILASARERRPGCFNFWLKAGATSLVGSSPELLVGLAGGYVRSQALAGSAPRGATGDQDAALGAALLASPKNRLEHDLVLSAVRAALAPVTGPVESPAEPSLMRLPEAQHLHTPVGGWLRSRQTVMQIAGLLHPTPSVCGQPRQAARQLIERDEPHRGWYTGAVGWMGAGGEGEFAVVLRSILIEGRRISAWAGAGIVEASDPDCEFAETQAKMSALLHRANQ